MENKLSKCNIEGMVYYVMEMTIQIMHIVSQIWNNGLIDISLRTVYSFSFHLQLYFCMQINITDLKKTNSARATVKSGIVD